MRWVERYKNEGNVYIHYRNPVAYKVKKESVKFLFDEIYNLLLSKLNASINTICRKIIDRFF
jgi:hypothetical protein